MTNPDYLRPVPDEFISRPSGHWAEEKLDYLRRYIDIFEASMKSKWPQRNYIDLFSGPGKNSVKKTNEILLGSPIIALITRYPFTGYYFSDLDKNSTKALDSRCKASPYYNIIHIYNGNANQKVDIIVTHIKKFYPRSLNLAFLDPDGLELEWSTVAKLGELRCDLIIHYSQQGITRFGSIAYVSEEETIVDRFFGTSEWRNVYSPWYSKPRKSGLHRALMGFYKERLQSLGYQEVKQSDEILTEPLIRNDKRNVILYRLIFASKHPLGETFWQKVTKRNVYGQKQMF
jgi:three-Cys-motif partner protein